MASPQHSIEAPARTVWDSLPPRVREQLALYRSIRDLRWSAMEQEQPQTAEGMLAATGLQCTVSDGDLAAVPSTGPLLVTVNRTSGLIENLAIACAISRVRPDLRILANHIIAALPVFPVLFIPTDPWQSRRAVTVNRRALAQSVQYLRYGGTLAVFPAGDRIVQWTARVDSGRQPWSTMAPRLALMTGATCLPCYLGNEKWASTGRGEIELRLGTPVSAERLAKVGTEQQKAAYLRWRTEELGRRHEKPARLVPRRVTCGTR